VKLPVRPATSKALSALSAGIFRFKGVSDRMLQTGGTFYALAVIGLRAPPVWGASGIAVYEIEIVVGDRMRSSYDTAPPVKAQAYNAPTKGQIDIYPSRIRHMDKPP
jgi:hypothetical protein